jgi:chemotaxis protein histidine kinase CheA
MVSREELYRLVWSEPMTKIAERFGVSSSYLARICELLNVPRPERGYWAKHAVQKAPQQTPLPEPRPGDLLHWIRDGQPVAPPRPKPPPRRSQDKKVRIPRTHAHALLIGARAHFAKVREVRDAQYLKPYKQLMLDVTTSQAGLDKALELANDLFNAFESVGHRVVMAPADAKLARARIDEREDDSKRRDRYQYSGLWSPYRPTAVYIGTVAIGLSIIEMSENVEMRYLNGKYIRESEYVAPRSRLNASYTWTTHQDLPSGRFRIVAYSPYGGVEWSIRWQETRSTSLRSQIKNIVEAVEAAAPELVEKVAEAERQAAQRRREWEAAEERRRREEDQRRVAQSITESAAELRQIIGQWSDVVAIERFLAGAEERANTLVGAERDQVLERLARARSFLGTQDPLDFLRGWRSPEEIYRPRYPTEDGE